MTTNVPDPFADDPDREEKAVGDLERGTWVEVVAEDGTVYGEARVLHVETYDEPLLGRRSVLLFHAPGYSPDAMRCNADMTMPLLTEDEVASKVDQERRELIAGQLETIAAMVRNVGAPLPPVWLPVTVGMTYHDEAAIEAFAKAFDIGVKRTAFQVYAGRQIDGDSGAGVELHAVMYIKADPTGLAYTRADDQPDDPTPVSGGRVEMHTGAMTASGLIEVDQSSDDPHAVCRPGDHPGQPCPRRALVSEARRARGADVRPWEPNVVAEVLPPGASCNGAPEGFEADCGMPGAHGPH